MTSVPNITLNNGIEIPQLGFGVWQVSRPRRPRRRRSTAFEVGYRHIDTAQMYGNEKGVGEAVRESGIDRGDVFITSKLNNGFHAHDDALKAFDRSLETLGFDYLDLFLIHWPLPGIDVDFVETWGALEEIYASGRAKAIGRLELPALALARVVQEGTVVPAVNQIEVHPFLTQDEVRAANAENGVATESWSPLAQGLVVDEPGDRGNRQGSRQVAGSGRAPLDDPARRHRVPQVGHGRADQGELRDLRLRAVRGRHGRHHGAQQGSAHRSQPGRVQLDPLIRAQIGLRCRS